jgi:hypothetical protein
VAAWALRGRLREALGIDSLEASVRRIEENLHQVQRDVTALRAEVSGEYDSPRARQRASSVELLALSGRITTLEGEVRAALSQLRELVRHALDGGP